MDIFIFKPSDVESENLAASEEYLSNWIMGSPDYYMYAHARHAGQNAAQKQPNTFCAAFCPTLSAPRARQHLQRQYPGARGGEPRRAMRRSVEVEHGHVSVA